MPGPSWTTCRTAGIVGPAMPRDVRRARRATTLVFFLTGAVFASWAARIPAVQERLGLGAGALAVAFLALNAGAVVGLPAGGVLVHRLGSRRTIVLGLAVYPPALVGAGLAPGQAWLAAGLGAMAAANSAVDLGMNAQGVEVGRRLGRPVLGRMHAGHSFGVLAGGLLGTAAAAAGVGVPVHFAVVAAV